jgi:23S rRNA pseudouridine1911/1915/1917 synthase
VNEGFDYRERIGAEADGEPLLAYLTRRYRHSSAAEWTERIESGRVLLDSTPGRPDSVLRQGQILVWRRPAWTEPDAPTSFAVLYEDEDLLAVAKPAGLPTLPGGGFLNATLLHRVRVYAPGASPLHRLGRWTSGVVLFARTRETLADLTRQWTSRDVGKRYRALAVGKPSRIDFEIEAPIGPVPHPLLGSVHAASADGKASVSHVAVVEQREGEFLCDVRIATGRPHQIRIHLAAAGHPLVGDPLYPAGGVPAPDCRALPGDPGYNLHAAELTFRHPCTARELVVTCEPPRVPRRS